jgi:AraC family transcriptional regulator
MRWSIPQKMNGVSCKARQLIYVSLLLPYGEGKYRILYTPSSQNHSSRGREVQLMAIAETDKERRHSTLNDSVSQIAMEKDTRDPHPFESRSPHGVRRIESHSRKWNGITVRNVVLYLDPGRVWHDLSSHETNVSILLDQSGGICEPRLNLNRPISRFRFDAGYANFIPADLSVWGYSEGIRSVRELRMIFTPKLLESILGDELDPAKLDKPVLMFYDNQITQCAALLADECQASLVGSRLFGENLTTALTAALFASRKAATQREQGLSRWQLRQAMDYLEANLTQDISLEEMARMSRLSQSQFARLFRTSTGMPPYKWSLFARIKRAQELLLLGKDSISAISVRTGFADQSHFSKTFRRVTGATPKDWQRTWRL